MNMSLFILVFSLGLVAAQVQQLFPIDSVPEGNFGNAIAIANNIAVVGSRYVSVQSESSGAAYIYEYNGEAWVLLQKLLPSSGQQNSNFGYAVAIDNTTIAVSSPLYYDNADQDAGVPGKVFIFERQGLYWFETQQLDPASTRDPVNFGWSLGFFNNVLFVGSPTDSTFASGAGAVYLFDRPGPSTPFVLSQKLFSDTVVAGTFFGHSLSYHQSTLAVGGVGFDDEVGSVLGSVFIFERTGSEWNQTATIRPPGITSLDSFGHAVGLSNDWLIVGAPYTAALTGAAYLCRRNNVTREWTVASVSLQRESLNLTKGALLGFSVSIYGNQIAIGAPGIADGGVVFVLTDIGNNGTWHNDYQLTAVTPQTSDGVGFSIGHNERHLFTGAPRYSLDTDNPQAGVVFTFASQDLSNRTIIVVQDNSTVFITPLSPLSVGIAPAIPYPPFVRQSPVADVLSPDPAVPLLDTTSDTNLSVLLPAIIVPVGAAIIGAVLFAVLYTRHQARQQARRMAVLNPMQSHALNDSKLTVPFQSLSVKTEIGSGSYGKVYKGVWNATRVALKFCNELASIDRFSEEARLMLNIPPHPNVVQLLAISVDGPVPVIVLEYCDNGSLDRALFDSTELVSEQKILHLVAGIARGMYHLHNNSIIHRDLAARNILLQHGEPKISDFGMSRIIKSSEGQTKSNIGPVRWMAPESLATQTYSTKTDVWTFGIVIYEIVARQEPHIDGDALLVASRIRDEYLTPAIPAACPAILKDLMQSCWQPDPDARPEFKQICDTLSHIV